MKRTEGWNVTALEYHPDTDMTYIVCGETRHYKVSGRWTPETMIHALKHLQTKSKER